MDALQAYRESGITDDDPVHLIVLLHDQLLRDLHRALDAFEKQDIPRRANELDHALLVVGQLQGTLNLESGGEVARNLDHFYNLFRDNLLRAVLEGSPGLLERQAQYILGLREAWLEVRRQQPLPDPQSGPQSAAPPADGHQDQDNDQSQRSSTWKA
ncbi:MAG TPA: flagellar export chaperone FliS [Terriglobales bacterium]|jgi:flagellar protein FliS